MEPDILYVLNLKNSTSIYFILIARNEVALLVVPVLLSPGVVFTTDATVDMIPTFKVVEPDKITKAETGKDT
jgi:hypothetical protein